MRCVALRGRRVPRETLMFLHNLRRNPKACVLASFRIYEFMRKYSPKLHCLYRYFIAKERGERRCERPPSCPLRIRFRIRWGFSYTTGVFTHQGVHICLSGAVSTPDCAAALRWALTTKTPPLLLLSPQQMIEGQRYLYILPVPSINSRYIPIVSLSLATQRPEVPTLLQPSVEANTGLTKAAKSVLGQASAASKKVLILTGATAVGKTDLSLRLAEALGGEIVSADSIQIYRDLDIGSDKLPLDKRKGIPHHLIDIRDRHDDYSAGAFHDEARCALPLLPHPHPSSILLMSVYSKLPPTKIIACASPLHSDAPSRTLSREGRSQSLLVALAFTFTGSSTGPHARASRRLKLKRMHRRQLTLP